MYVLNWLALAILTLTVVLRHLIGGNSRCRLWHMVKKITEKRSFVR